ncbi:MAG: hypothetical protein ACYDCO_16015 [Armatimonadota bacterium]
MRETIKTTGLLLAAMLAGYVGGLLSQGHSQAQAQAPPPPAAANVVRARSFQMVDEAGRVRADLRVDQTRGSCLAFYDSAGKVRGYYSSSMFFLCSPGGQGGFATLAVMDGTGAVLGLGGGEAGPNHATFGAYADGSVTLEQYDTGGKLSSMLGIRDGGTLLNQYDAAGELRSTFSVFKTPYLGFADAAGKLRASMTLLADGRPGIGLLNARGDVFWQAPP